MLVLGRYLKENLAEIIMYIGFMSVFPTIFYLYNIRMDAVKYASVLGGTWFLIWEAGRFARYKRRHDELLVAERRAPAELSALPKAKTAVEEDYQRILGKVYKDKVETESASREFRREMMDYYGM